MNHARMSDVSRRLLHEVSILNSILNTLREHDRARPLETWTTFLVHRDMQAHFPHPPYEHFR